MKKSEAKPGVKVIASISYNEWGDVDPLTPYFIADYDDETTLIGVIRSREAQAGHVWVKWIEGQFEEDEEEVDIKLLTLESDRDKIEQEFKKVSKEIKEKMKTAADLVKEAGKLARKAHAKSLQDMYDVCSPLIDAMDDNGWRSSSWGC